MLDFTKWIRLVRGWLRGFADSGLRARLHQGILPIPNNCRHEEPNYFRHRIWKFSHYVHFSDVLSWSPWCRHHQMRQIHAKYLVHEVLNSLILPHSCIERKQSRRVTPTASSSLGPWVLAAIILIVRAPHCNPTESQKISMSNNIVFETNMCYKYSHLVSKLAVSFKEKLVPGAEKLLTSYKWTW